MSQKDGFREYAPGIPYVDTDGSIKIPAIDVTDCGLFDGGQNNDGQAKEVPGVND